MSVRSTSPWMRHETDEEVGHVLVGAPVVDVGDREAEALVLHVGLHPLVLLEQAREALLPRVAAHAVEHHVVEMRLGRRWVHHDLAGHEAHIVGAARRVEAADDRHEHRRTIVGLADDRPEDLLGCAGACLGEQQVALRHTRLGGHALLQPSAADVDELRKEPRPLDAGERGEELLALHERPGERERDSLGAGVADVFEVDLLALADDAATLDPQGHGALVEVQARLIVEVGVQRLVGQLDAVAVELGEADRQIPSIRQRTHLDRRARVARRGDLPVARDEGERHAVHLGVLRLEASALVRRRSCAGAGHVRRPARTAAGCGRVGCRGCG